MPKFELFFPQTEPTCDAQSLLYHHKYTPDKVGFKRYFRDTFMSCDLRGHFRFAPVCWSGLHLCLTDTIVWKSSECHQGK